MDQPLDFTRVERYVKYYFKTGHTLVESYRLALQRCKNM